MAGGKRRLTRSSEQQSKGTVEKIDKREQHEQIESPPVSKNLSSGKKNSLLTTDTELHSYAKQTRTLASTSVSISNRKAKCQQEKPKNSKKRRLCHDVGMEKENLKLSKRVADTAIQYTKETKSNDCDAETDNNESGNYKPVTSGQCQSSRTSSQKSKMNSESPYSSSSMTSLSCKSVTMAIGRSKIQTLPSKHAAVSPARSGNIYHEYLNSLVGKSLYQNSESVSRITANQLSEFEVTTNDKPFQCRITSIEWHPRMRNFLGVGSKHGDMIFYKIKHEDHSMLEEVQKFYGIGPGGNISSMKFHPTLDNLVYTSSLCGKVSLVDIEGRNNDILLDTMSWDFWYSSLDVHMTDFFVAAGRNKGNAAFLDKDGKLIWDKKLHRQKISHLEFSPRDPYLFCTASLDHTVKLWDLRKVVEKMPLESLNHKHGLNSAYFSLTDGCRLLTTDQNDEIRIYSYPSWNLEKTILHPHRFFQHITPIKAYWHPHKDIVFCGRYPNPTIMPEYRMLRCIDMFDASKGERLGEMFDPTYNGLISLVKMNNEGTKLACSMGYNLNLWNSENRAHSANEVKVPQNYSKMASGNVTPRRSSSDVSQKGKKLDKEVLHKKKMKSR